MMGRRIGIVSSAALLVASQCAGQDQRPTAPVPKAQPAAEAEPSAQTPAKADEQQRPHFRFDQYVTEVVRNNPDLAAQRALIPIAQAAVTSAKITPDWTFDFGFPTVDLSNQGNPTQISAGLDVPIELGGKRGKRVRAATSDVSTANADLDEAVRQLRSAAADAFVDSLSARDVLQSKNTSYAQLDRIVSVNQERLRAGDIGEIELVQSRVERDRFKADVITAEVDVYSADLVLGRQLGRREELESKLPVPEGRLEIASRQFDIEQLVAGALLRRPDVVSRQRALHAAEERIELANANLVPDVTVSGAYSHLAAGTGGFIQPADNTLSAALSLNLPFSRWRYRGEVEAAQSSRTEAELQLRATQIHVEAEVRDAYSRYQAAAKRLRVYQFGLLNDAQRVLDGRLYAYQRGGSTLLEVIDAQRTDADIRLAYAEALADHAHALIALETAATIWDISF